MGGKEGDKQESSQNTEQQNKKASKKPPKLGPKKASRQTAPKKEEDKKKDGQDLTALLDESQRGDLTLLLANATQSMRKRVEDNFDARAGLNRALLRKDMSEDEKLMSADVDPGNADVAALDRERKLKLEQEKDLSSPDMRNLKKDALEAFDDWRQAVIERVGQVLNTQRNAQAQVKQDAKAGKAQPQAPEQKALNKVVEKPSTQGTKLKFRDLYPPTQTPLTKMPMDQRVLVLHSLLLMLLSLKHYNALSRVLLLHLTSSLKLPLRTFEQDEVTVAKGLLEAAKELSADAETKKKAEQNKESRKWRVGWATAAGATVIGISGGMAAPLVSSGVGTIMGSLGLGATAAAGYLGSLAGSTVLVAGLFGAYGGRMTGQMMDHYAREVEDFEFLPVHSRNKTSEKAEEGAQQATGHNHKLRVTICISGWLTEKEEVVRPWKVIGRGAEVFSLKWELEALLNLGNAMQGLVQSAAWGYAQKQLVQKTVFADLMAAMWPVGLVKAAGVIDNPFSVAKERSEKAGEVLADALVNRAQGERPVTLIGYSLGARLIYTCLKSLAKRKAFGLVESAILIGAPTPSDAGDWRIIRSAVSARLVNIYSENDKVLGFMYRTSSIQYGVAGLQKIEGLAGVENVNVSEDVNGHLRYRYLIGHILSKIGFADIDMQAVEEEQTALEQMEKEEEKNSLRSQKNRLLRRESKGGKEDEAKEAEEEAGDIQKEVTDKTRKSLVTRAVEYFYLPHKQSPEDIERNLGNVQKAAADPAEAGAVAMEALRDIQRSGQSYAQWAAQQFPSLPSRGQGSKASGKLTKATSETTRTPSKSTADAASISPSYTQAASIYLSTWRGGASSATQDPTKPADKAAQIGSNAADTKGVTSGSDKNAGPSLPDSKQGKKAADSTARNPTQPAQSYTSRAAGYFPRLRGVSGGTPSTPVNGSTEASMSEAAGSPKPPSVGQDSDPPTAKNVEADEMKDESKDGKKDANKDEKTDKPGKTQGYSSFATGYLPSVPRFGRGAPAGKSGSQDSPIPTTPTSNRAPSESKKKAPKLARKAGEQTPTSSPSLSRHTSQAKNSIPESDGKSSSMKSPPSNE